jgi:NAD(P)-dependent dehydrogenase (short-subunit alcohol dehydrogenase family)
MIGTGTAANARSLFAHCVGKGAVIRMTTHLAVELSPLNVRVNVISPGVIDTPATHAVLGDSDDSEVRRTFLDQLLLQRIGQPDDIVNAAVFLASDEASYITGVNLPVDGGWTGGGGMGMPSLAFERALDAALEGFLAGGVALGGEEA